MNSILASHVAAVAVLGDEWTIAAASPAFCRLLGRNEAELVGRSFLDFTVAQANGIDALVAAGQPDASGVVPLDFRVAGAAAKPLWVRARIRLAGQADGTPVPREIALMEIDDLRDVGCEPAGQIALLDKVFAVIDPALRVSRVPDGQTLYVSPDYDRIWGVNGKALWDDGQGWLDMIHPDDRLRVETEVRRQRQAGQPFDVEYRIVRPDGAFRWIRDRGMAAHDALGHADVYIGSAQDITERRHLEVELARLQAADNIVVAADLAHNFNNLLAIVDLCAHAIQRQDQHGLHGEKLASLHVAVERGAEITRLLLAISSRQMLDPGYVDANAVITEFKPLIAASLGPLHRVSYDMTSLSCPLYIDQTGLNQAILNLVKNSREAMPDGGEILVKTRVVPAIASPDHDHAAGRCVEISIEDTGTGMTEHALRHAMDPYFTTKSTGAGFGLAITNGFVTQSSGRLVFANRRGGGLIARMTFPHCASPERGDAARGAAGGLRPGGILIVDDEPIIAAAIGEILAIAGHQISTATTIREARAQLEQGRFAVLICDVSLGGEKTGVDLMLWAKGRMPHVKVLMMSGYNSSKVALPDNVPFIRKPFPPDELTAVVAQIMAQQQPNL